LQGRWLAVAQERGGAGLTQEQLKTEDNVLTIAGDRFQMTYNRLPNPSERAIEEGRILSFDLTEKPAEVLMRFDILKPEPILFKGIFELNGDRLRHCYRKCPLNENDCTSPETFSTKKRAGSLLRRVRASSGLVLSTNRDRWTQSEVQESRHGVSGETHNWRSVTRCGTGLSQHVERRPCLMRLSRGQPART
jgi:uncharacterized protein (TIGR03067 family)